MRYIDVDALIERLKSDYCEGCNNNDGIRCRSCDVDFVFDMVDDAPEADVVEVRHGRWIINDEDYWTKCSVCEFEYFDEQENIYNTYIYCPHCGAKMDKGVTE